MAHRRDHGGRMVVRWRGEAMMRRCSAVPSCYVVVADWGDAPSSGEVLPTMASFSSLLLPPLSLSHLNVVWCYATSGDDEWAEG